MKWLPRIGILGFAGYMVYQIMNSTALEMYNAFRNKGDTVLVAATKALGEQMKDMYEGMLSLFGINKPLDKKELDEIKRKRIIIQGHIEELERLLKDNNASAEEKERMIGQLTSAMKEEVALELKWNNLYDKRIKASNQYWFFISRAQIEMAKQAIDPLTEMLESFHKEYDDELKKLKTDINLLQRKLAPLYRLKNRTPEENNQIRLLEAELENLQRRQTYLKGYQKRLTDELVRLRNLEENPYIVWDDVVNFWGWITTQFKEAHDQRKAEELELLAAVNEFWSNDPFGTILRSIRDFFKNLLSFFTLPKFQSEAEMKKTADEMRKNRENFETTLEATRKKLLEEQENKRLLNEFKNLGELEMGKGPIYKPTGENSVEGTKHGGNKFDEIPTKKWWENMYEKYFKKSSFETEQNLAPAERTAILKTLSHLVTNQQNLQMASILNTRNTTISNSTSSSTNISAPTTLVAQVAPVGVPWSEFSSYGSFVKTGYNI